MRTWRSVDPSDPTESIDRRPRRHVHLPMPGCLSLHLQALAALEKMEAAVALYRKTARIDTADGGIGEFPTDTKVGASFSNNNPALLKRTIK